jgi:hypothetical protein
MFREFRPQFVFLIEDFQKKNNQIYNFIMLMRGDKAIIVISIFLDK